MKKIIHLLYWLIFIGLILFLFSGHVVAEALFQRFPDAHALAKVIS